MAKLSELRKKAKDMGIAAAVIRRATTASELQAVISDHNSHGNGKPKKKSAVAKKKATVAKKKSSSKPARKQSGRKASTPAKSKTGAKAKRSSNSNGDSGRNLLGKVNFSKTDGWNPRDGSAPDRIIKALKRFKGDRSKVFTHLKGDIWEFVQKKKNNGEKRTKAEAEEMLRYRISRTAFDFAVRTGQHEPSTNRVEYGTGGTGNGKAKPKSKSGSKPAARKAAKKSTRKPAKAQKPAQKRGRGRPKGSKNRPKAGSRK